MTPPTATIAWAIKAPVDTGYNGYPGNIVLESIRHTKIESIRAFMCGETNWRHWYRRGYRCVRVTVQECKE